MNTFARHTCLSVQLPFKTTEYVTKTTCLCHSFDLRHVTYSLTSRQAIGFIYLASQTRYKAQTNRGEADSAAREHCKEKPAEHPDDDKQTHKTDKENDRWAIQRALRGK